MLNTIHTAAFLKEKPEGMRAQPLLADDLGPWATPLTVTNVDFSQLPYYFTTESPTSSILFFCPIIFLPKPRMLPNVAKSHLPRAHVSLLPLPKDSSLESFPIWCPCLLSS